jgi:hypothetical protein
MTRYLAQQLTQSTADDARNYFSGVSRPVGPVAAPVLPQGKYRVIDGVLHRIVAGVPPALDGGTSRPAGKPPLDP